MYKERIIIIIFLWLKFIEVYLIMWFVFIIP